MMNEKGAGVGFVESGSPGLSTKPLKEFALHSSKRGTSYIGLRPQT